MLRGHSTTSLPRWVMKVKIRTLLAGSSNIAVSIPGRVLYLQSYSMTENSWLRQCNVLHVCRYLIL